MRCALLLLLLFPFLMVACQNTPVPGAGSARFPESWAGTWVGELRIYGAAKPQSVPMQLEVGPLGNTWRWKIVYGGPDKRDVRDYRLRVVDAAKGDYEIDEKNSVVLPATLRGGALLSRFSVKDSSILSVYRRIGDAILFELFAGPKQAAKVTGGTGVPMVEGHKIGTRQEAVLRRR